MVAFVLVVVLVVVVVDDDELETGGNVALASFGDTTNGGNCTSIKFSLQKQIIFHSKKEEENKNYYFFNALMKNKNLFLR